MCLSVVVDGQLVISWTVFSVFPGETFFSLYEKLQAGSLELFQKFTAKLQRSRLSRAHVGATKDNMSTVDNYLPIDEVCRQFGSFCRLHGERQEIASTPAPRPTTVNAFQILMASQVAQRRLSELPLPIGTPRNKKDKMFNDIVILFNQKEWKWSDGGDTHGKKFIIDLRDVLWYIDGHHSMLEQRSCSIPEPFNKFVGYNTPEKSKHRKRQIGNLSLDALTKHVQALKQSQITSWMQQSRWRELRDCICKLTTVLDDHCTYLQEKCKSMKVRHDSMVVPDTDSGTVRVLPTNTSVSCRIAPLDKIMQEKPCYEKVGINDFCSVDPKIKYQYVQDLKKGLTIPCILYTASLGSNLGNHLFLWKIPHGVTLEAATTENVRIIDSIKRALPTYHSRAMRR